MKTRLLLLTAILSIALLGVANASMITDWEYATDAAFTSWEPVADITADTYNPIATSPDNPLPAVSPTGSYAKSLTWGDPVDADETSNLQLGDAVTGNAETNGAFENGVSLTHNNFPITGGDYLTDATALDGLSLMPTLPADHPLFNDLQGAPLLTFAIDFFETPNAADPCANGNPNGSGVNANGCGDIFAITAPGIFDIVTGEEGGVDYLEFTVPFLTTIDYNYFVTTRLSGVTILDIEGTGFDGDFGFVTAEDASNLLTTGFKVTAAPVPEPSTFLLLGAGLLGLGYQVRRRRK